MWELELLGRVVPAFGALARQYRRRLEDKPQDARLRDAEDCYQDLVLIGHAVYMSGGEWTSGLDDIDVTKLLAAFETRFPKKRLFLPAWKFYGATEIAYDARTQFPQLHDLACSIASFDLGGYNECYEILSQSDEQHQKYLDILGSDISLFRGSEQTNWDKREKFLKRVRVAAKHLLEVYCKDDTGPEAESLTLSQHPSHGAKESADKLYKCLQRHWRCDCPQRATKQLGAREARLSLTRYRQFAPRVPKARALASLNFEIVLPVCKDKVEWKVTNVEVKSVRSQVIAATSRQAIDHDLCEYLRKSGRMAQEHFLLENEDLWHLKAELLEENDRHTLMEPLEHFLGDSFEASYISQCNPREQLILCYILATSMLYLYPSSWYSTEWTSSMVHFVRRSETSTSPALTHPYVSIPLQAASNAKVPPDRHRIHAHPAILALGIMFLEIATGSRFKRTREDTPTEQCNEDNARAWQDFKAIEKKDRYGHAKQLPSSLRAAIRACLKLEPPANFPSNQLSEEGPIRHYILSCIVRPLARELEDGYKVSLKDLHRAVLPGMDSVQSDEAGGPSLSRQSTASVDKMFRNSQNDITLGTSVNLQLNFASEISASHAIRQAACLYREREELVDERKVKAASTWFDWHKNALTRLYELRHHDYSETPRVKIAILDSGIELSQDNIDIYNTEPQMRYRSWIDRDQTWRDEAGHGTHLAVLVRKVAPNALVHVGRVFKKRPTRQSAGVIAEAIRYAVDEWKVDIVVMSFGFGEEDESLYSSIQHAASNGVALFAAASNDGKNRPDGMAWPARDNNVICVHSGDGLGNPSIFTPDPQDGMRIMVLGECVNSAWPAGLNCKDGHRLMSGTSCAAPIAAAIAALILDYSRGFLTTQQWLRLRRVDSMRRLFHRMAGSGSRNGYWWIKHWAWFDPDKDEGWIKVEIKSAL